jgi:hypothetical protein
MLQEEGVAFRDGKVGGLPGAGAVTAAPACAGLHWARHRIRLVAVRWLGGVLPLGCLADTPRRLPAQVASPAYVVDDAQLLRLKADKARQGAKST